MIGPEYGNVSKHKTNWRAMTSQNKNGRLVLPFGLLGLSLLFPIAYIVQTSLDFSGHFGFGNYRAIFTNGANFVMFRNTILVALVVVSTTLVSGYCIAILLRLASPVMKLLLTAALIYPFFTSVLVKSFSFIVILGPTGPVTQISKAMGFGKVSLLYTWIAVIIGMSYSLLPYMTLTLYASVSGVEEQVLLAARNMGAGKLRTLFTVLIPMTRGGIIGGSLLVFVLSFGYYVTPALLGGPRDTMVAMAVADEALTALNFGAASALAIGIVAVVGVIFVIYMRLVGIDALIRGNRL